ncbi:beta-ketoacyl-[acyl-carrier-protein] synthase family protein [Methylocystis sp. MJC1]|uniref:beta-ketoacyl-[acyl-carrier-protein] synthase family protein n=1 Tax=Methylocystis sp. MJC1 TaxID=2654282 RepID=UPI0013E99F04|nr:beta-ketoacyl-[acyl-carrier-protein] synthase family protein [Methylocystis sp. MJC1]KAF2990791.1 3-oxoacyl-[acyl-carrier-protein] synthase 2 [Methylocystis sp. MJC1]MBU6528612.1 beta-ketoacyl-[acyl-carrier-protein] synthase family protein [Methylocystis sp. MJC1]UZX11505.1 beta-ketoacyl-[acyl-carrier-protein] synthase family protein [Methylocystis sp. MJC1]
MAASRRGEAGRRVVVSGMGVVCASGVGARKLWEAARDGVAQIRELKTERPYDGRIKIAAQVPDFDPAAYIEANVLPFCDPFTQFAVVAADEAMAQAGFGRKDIAGPRTAVIMGSGIGGMTTIEDGIYKYYVEHTRPETLSVPKLIPSAMPTTLSARFSALGPTFAVGSACSSASQSIGLGLQMIRSGMVDKAIVGGAEACVINATIRAWEGLRVMTPNFCRPFSMGRNGMSLGEGAAVFILETAESARARGHEPLCELTGYGTTSDAKDPVRPDLDGAANCIAAALEDAGLAPRDIHYINAHGTATHANDITESEAILRVFGDDYGREVPVSSTKPIHGHALGAGGGLELAITIEALREQIAPPTINFLEFDARCPIDAVPNVARLHKIDAAMSNSFAFGGINAVLIVRHAA